MSFKDALNEIATAALDEFQWDVTVIPQLRLPNERPRPDPNRPAYQITGIFDPNKHGGARAESELQVHHKGRHQTTVLTLHPQLTVRRADLRYPIVQGDELIIEGERFRALSEERAMQGLTRITLEELGSIVPA